VPIGTEVFEMNEENVQGDKAAAVIQRGSGIRGRGSEEKSKRQNVKKSKSEKKTPKQEGGGSGVGDRGENQHQLVPLADLCHH
jgi:hypothetical protein